MCFYAWFQEFVSHLGSSKPIVIMFAEDALQFVREIRLEIVKLSSPRNVILRVDFLGCAEGNFESIRFSTD